MKVTLQDIAEDTGYSVSTVSRVLNGSDKISLKARDEILKSAERFDYKIPKLRNTRPITRTLDLVLLATGFHEGEFYVSFFHGLNLASIKNNVRLFLLGVETGKEKMIQTLKKTIVKNYDGAILFFPEYTRSDYLEIKKEIPSDYPIISNALIENPVFPTITFDGYSGGHLAAKHLEDRGYHTLGILKGPMERAESRFRLNGFKDYISHHSDVELVWETGGDFTFESGVKAFKEYLNLNRKPRAIFASNDAMCNGFMEAAKQHRLHFPEDVAIIGYDDLPVCRHNQPTMSSVHTNYEQLGDATMKAIREKISNPQIQNNLLSFVSVDVSARNSS